LILSKLLPTAEKARAQSVGIIVTTHLIQLVATYRFFARAAAIWIAPRDYRFGESEVSNLPGHLQAERRHSNALTSDP
jgi:hypothetical protein